MGLHVRDIQLRNKVVVLKGCSVPLRPRDPGEHMVVVGESPVSSIVDGEVMAGMGG